MDPVKKRRLKRFIAQMGKLKKQTRTEMLLKRQSTTSYLLEAWHLPLPSEKKVAGNAYLACETHENGGYVGIQTRGCLLIHPPFPKLSE